MKSKFEKEYGVICQQFKDGKISEEEFYIEMLRYTVAMDWSFKHSERIKEGLRKKKEREEQEKKKKI